VRSAHNWPTCGVVCGPEIEGSLPGGKFGEYWDSSTIHMNANVLPD